MNDECPRCPHGKGFKCRICWPIRYLDGSPVEPQYLAAVSKLVGEAADIEEQIGINELDGGG